MIYRSFAGLLLLCFVGCLTSTIAQSPQASVIPNEDQKVLQAVLVDFFKRDKQPLKADPVKKLVIRSRTIDDRWPSSRKDLTKVIKYLLKDVKDETIASYLDNKRSTAAVDSKFDVPVPYVMFSQEDRAAIFKNGPAAGWQEFFLRYPGADGIIGFSRVGFDSSRQQALVYIEHGCGSLCATGYYILLKKDGNNWRVVDKNIAGMS